MANIATDRGRDPNRPCKIFEQRRLLDVQLKICLQPVERDRRSELALRQFDAKPGDMLANVLPVS